MVVGKAAGVMILLPWAPHMSMGVDCVEPASDCHLKGLLVVVPGPLLRSQHIGVWLGFTNVRGPEDRISRFGSKQDGRVQTNSFQHFPTLSRIEGLTQPSRPILAGCTLQQEQPANKRKIQQWCHPRLFG